MLLMHDSRREVLQFHRAGPTLEKWDVSESIRPSQRHPLGN